MVFTNYFFTGGDPQALTLDQDVVVRMNDMRSLHVRQRAGALARLQPHRGDPQSDAQFPGRASGRTILKRLSATSVLPFLRARQVEGPDKDRAWRLALSTPDALAVGRPLLSQPQDRRRRYGSIRDRPAPREVPATDLHLHAEATAQAITPRPTRPSSSTPTPDTASISPGAMAMLLRFNGIPARVAVGFATGDLESPGVYSVATNNAHAWVEAYFPTVGWVAFDPTPGRSLPNAGRLVHQPGFQGPLRLQPSGQTTAYHQHRAHRPTQQAERRRLQDSSRVRVGSAAFPGCPGCSACWCCWALGPPAGSCGGREVCGGAPWTSASPPRCGCYAAASPAYGLAVTGGSTMEEILDIIETRLGAKPDPVLAARAGAVLFGGRRGNGRGLRAGRGVPPGGAGAPAQTPRLDGTILAWYGVPHRGRRRAARRPGRSRGPRLGLSL